MFSVGGPNTRKSKTADGRHSEKSKIIISRQRFDRFSQSFALYRILTDPLNRRPLKIQIFKNPRWQTAIISKIEKSPFLHNDSRNRTDIWQDDAEVDTIYRRFFKI